MKVLFVTHALENLYGAATSLRLLLQNYTSIEADILVQRSFRNPRDLSAIAKSFPSVRNVYEMSLPVRHGILGIQRSLDQKIHGAVHWISWQRDRGRYLRLLRDNKYDLVHFNSPVLHAMVSTDMPAVIHMRDIILGHSTIIEKLARAKGIVFIDAATRKPFAAHEGVMHAVTLNNPVDMEDTASFSDALQHPLLTPNVTVFSMVGLISEIKGTDLVIAAFRNSASLNALLLIVGNGPADYMARCHEVAGDDPRIVFWGEEPDIKKIYANTDYVVRGDPVPCIGRTVYEGLYAGCQVMMPGPLPPDLIFEADLFGKSIHWYQAGNREALASLFAARAGRKVLGRKYRSNLKQYVEAFDGFLETCLARTNRGPE